MKDNSGAGRSVRLDPKKFQNPRVTADNKTRAYVDLQGVKTLWFNTGTLCNITCKNCYIESSPKNDRLVYIGAGEVREYLDEAKQLGWPVEEIGLTGGEPFMNPEIIEIMQACLEAGYRLLVLTNAMRPMMRKKCQVGLEELCKKYKDKMVFRVSLDHWSAKYHELERGRGSFARALSGMQWLHERGIKMAVAGRSLWQEDEAVVRAGFAELYRKMNFNIDAYSIEETMIFPEMDEEVDVPEITTECWDILNKSPDDIMCATSRMVVKRKGAAHPTTLSCTLLAYEAAFDLGRRLKDSEAPIYLNHPHCAKFCVLGGASCSKKSDG